MRSEFRRAASRRLFWLLSLIAVGLTVFVGAMVFLRTGQPGHALEFATAAPRGLHIAAVLLFSLGVVCGASFVGAEWSSGSMAILLTWEPRRGRVLVAKLVSIAFSAAAVALALFVVVVLVLFPSGAFHGSTAGLTSTWWREMLAIWWRGGALVAMGAALGVGLAGILRNSAGAVATWLIFQFVVAQVLTLWKPRLFRWLPQGNVELFLSSRIEVLRADRRLAFLPPPNVVRGGLTLLVYAAGLVVLSYGVFRARDVT